MYKFEYRKATDLSNAREAMKRDEGARLLAGGMSLLPAMKHRLAAPSTLVDIGGLGEMRGITHQPATANAPATLTIGANMRHQEVADSAEVQRVIPALACLASKIGDPQVRARGTLGGSVANNDPAADYPAAVLGLDAVVITDQREIAAADFFQGMFTTALKEGEIIVALRFAVPRRAAWAKFAQMATGFAMTGVLLSEHPGHINVAVTGAGPSVFRWAAAEQALSQNMSEAALLGLQHPAGELTDDIHAPASYRAHLISVMTRQALRDLLQHPQAPTA